MNEAKKEIAELIASVTEFPEEEGYDEPGVFEQWDLQTIRESRLWTAVAFVAETRTDWYTFARDVTVAPSSGRIFIQYEQGEDRVRLAEAGHPVLVPQGQTARYAPDERVRGVLLFIPPIIGSERDA